MHNSLEVNQYFVKGADCRNRNSTSAASAHRECHLRALLSVCGICSFGDLGVVLVVCVCVGVGGVALCRCVCVCVCV